LKEKAEVGYAQVKGGRGEKSMRIKGKTKREMSRGSAREFRERAGGKGDAEW